MAVAQRQALEYFCACVDIATLPRMFVEYAELPPDPRCSAAAVESSSLEHDIPTDTKQVVMQFIADRIRPVQLYFPTSSDIPVDHTFPTLHGT